MEIYTFFLIATAVVGVYATAGFLFSSDTHLLLAKRSESRKKERAHKKLIKTKSVLKQFEILSTDRKTLLLDNYIRNGEKVSPEAYQAYERRMRTLLVKEDNSIIPVVVLRRSDMEALSELQLLNEGQTFHVTIDLIDDFPLQAKRIVDVRYDYERLPPENQLAAPQDIKQLNE